MRIGRTGKNWNKPISLRHKAREKKNGGLNFAVAGIIIGGLLEGRGTKRTENSKGKT